MTQNQIQSAILHKWCTKLHSYPNVRCMHAYIHTYIHTHAYMHTPTHTHAYIETYIHAYIETYIHTYIGTYIHTYIHTPLHTYRLLSASSPEGKGPPGRWRESSGRAAPCQSSCYHPTCFIILLKVGLYYYYVRLMSMGMMVGMMMMMTRAPFVSPYLCPPCCFW